MKPILLRSDPADGSAVWSVPPGQRIRVHHHYLFLTLLLLLPMTLTATLGSISFFNEWITSSCSLTWRENRSADRCACCAACCAA